MYTGGGNDGTTCIPDGMSSATFSGRGSKGNILIETNNYINTFNIKLGWLYGYGMDKWIELIQGHLVLLMGEVISSSNELSLNSYTDTFGYIKDEHIDQVKEFLNVVKLCDITIDGWVKYNNKRSLPFHEACEACRLAEIYIVKAKDEGCEISHFIVSYFNYLSKMLFMMGYIVDKGKEKIVENNP
jgi:cob(I)alamin adenosyltransferase